MQVQVAQGAEARVWKCNFLQQPAIIKQRFSKGYRHPSLDESLTRERLRAEARCMVRARKLGVLAPVPYFVETKAATIYMQFINGDSVKSVRPKFAHWCLRISCGQACNLNPTSYPAPSPECY
jgi:TP53 regulating kinase and related kinases